MYIHDYTSMYLQQEKSTIQTKQSSLKEIGLSGDIPYKVRTLFFLSPYETYAISPPADDATNARLDQKS